MLSKIPQELLTRRTLNDVVRILERSDRKKLPDSLSEEGLVLFDLITELWNKSKPLDRLGSITSFINPILDMRKKAHSIFLQRWFILDALESASRAPDSLYSRNISDSMNVLNFVTGWINEPHFRTAEIVYAIRLRARDADALGAPSAACAGNAVVCASESPFRHPANLFFYVASAAREAVPVLADDKLKRTAFEQAVLRCRLLEEIEPWLPEAQAPVWF